MFWSSECHLHKFCLGGTYYLIAELIFNLPLKNINALLSILFKGIIPAKCLKKERTGNTYLWKQYLIIIYWNSQTFPQGSYFFLYWYWCHSVFIERLISQHSVPVWTFWTRTCCNIIFFAVLNMSHNLFRTCENIWVSI